MYPGYYDRSVSECTILVTGMFAWCQDAVHDDFFFYYQGASVECPLKQFGSCMITHTSPRILYDNLLLRSGTSRREGYYELIFIGHAYWTSNHFFPLRPWVHVVPVSELILTWNQILCLNHCNINPRFIFLRNSFFLVQTELTDGTKSHTHIERLISKTTFQRLVPNRSRFTATRVWGRAGGRGLVWVRACGRSLLDLLLAWIRIFFFLTYLIYSHSFLNIFFTPAVWNLPRL